MIDTVIFDFDGLLVDTEIIAYEIYHQFLINTVLFLPKKNTLNITVKKQIL